MITGYSCRSSDLGSLPAETCMNCWLKLLQCHRMSLIL